MRAERLGGPGVADGTGAPGVARAGRLLLQGRAQLVEVALASVPHAGQPGADGRPGVVAPGAPAQGLVLQPHPAPVGEPGHDQLAGEGGDEVLVELSGQEVGGLGEEGQRAAAQPLPVAGAAPAGPCGHTGRVVRAVGIFRHHRARGRRPVRAPGVRPGPRCGPGHPDALDARSGRRGFGETGAGPGTVRGLRAAGRQPRPHRLGARAVGDAPGLRERGDEAQAAPVLGGVVRCLVVAAAARGTGGVPVRDLDDEGARLLHPEAHLDVGTGVHDGVGDQLADDDQGVGGEVLGQVLRAGQSERGPVGERGARHGSGGARRQGAAQ